MPSTFVYHGGPLGGGGGGGAGGGLAIDAGEVMLTYGATVDINLQLGSIFYLNLTAVACQINNPTNFSIRNKFILRLVQPVTANGLVTWDTKFNFSTSLPVPVLSAVANAWDDLAFTYNAVNDSFDLVGLVTGFV